VRRLALATILLAVFTLLAYIGYVLILGQSMPSSARVGEDLRAAQFPAHPASATLAFHRATSLPEISL
jgi:hypothetical protein